MIFVTVGTHEQPFDRLIKLIDKMVENKKITEKVIIQKGYSIYEPKNCEAYTLVSYEEMKKYIEEARIVITHGGPSSFIDPLSIGKIPIVVPRQKVFNEHVNDHQLDFAVEMEKRMKNIIVAETENDIEYSILHYDELIKKLNNNRSNNNERFNDELEKIVKNLFN